MNENGTKAVLFVKQNGTNASLMLQMYDKTLGKWGTPKAMTDGKNAINGFSGLVTSEGAIEVLVNEIDLIEKKNTSYEQADLLWIGAGKCCDVSIEAVSYDCSQYVIGSDMTFDVSVENKGTLPISSLQLSICDSAGTVLSEEYCSVALAPGDTKTVTIGYTPITAEQGKNLSSKSSPIA